MASFSKNPRIGGHPRAIISSLLDQELFTSAGENWLPSGDQWKISPVRFRQASPAFSRSMNSSSMPMTWSRKISPLEVPHRGRKYLGRIKDHSAGEGYC